MKRRLRMICLWLFFALAGCNYFGANGKDGSAKVLEDPAYALLSDSIRQFPGNAALYLNRAVFLSQQNLYELAYPDYKKAWQLQPDESTAIAYTANLFMCGRDKEAVGFLQQCIRRFPQNNEFRRRLSETYLQTGRSKEALVLFDNMIRTDSNNFEAFYEKGNLLAQMKDTVAAIAALEKAYVLQPLQLTGISLANLYAESGNPKTLPLCDELIAKDTAKELTDAVYLKGVYFSNVQKPAQALEQFEECIRRDWKFTEAYIDKGIILYQQKNIDEALKTFALAARVSNTYPDAYFWMGKCFEASGKKEEARTNYSRALALDKNFTEAREGLKRLGE